MSSNTKLDQNWEKIFLKYKILDEIKKNGFFEITSKEINEFREARLMTKFDHRSQLPIERQLLCPVLRQLTWPVFYCPFC
ncbi:Uncharacterised protein [Oligella ureolytica]|uniref:DUF6996 domain-containing protein n=1 Tax=Oligella ureolytica TaxID=90244 RepID=A0A378X9U2_9BURK|nr:hypothetical protein [Oligella ureolytica]SUA50448.1 Uncharacterised protein [Oligella ureolytica]